MKEVKEKREEKERNLEAGIWHSILTKRVDRNRIFISEEWISMDVEVDPWNENRKKTVERQIINEMDTHYNGRNLKMCNSVNKSTRGEMI